MSQKAMQRLCFYLLIGLTLIFLIVVVTMYPFAVYSGVQIPVSTLIALLAIYFVGAELGATQVFAGNAVHEWVHDARHLLGFPCH